MATNLHLFKLFHQSILISVTDFFFFRKIYFCLPRNTSFLFLVGTFYFSSFISMVTRNLGNKAELRKTVVTPQFYLLFYFTSAVSFRKCNNLSLTNNFKMNKGRKFEQKSISACLPKRSRLKSLLYPGPFNEPSQASFVTGHGSWSQPGYTNGQSRHEPTKYHDRKQNVGPKNLSLA